MKKRFTFVLLLVFALALVACGGDRGKNSGGKIVDWYELSEDAKYEGGKVTIKFWHRMGAENLKIVDKWIAEFNETYPQIEVISEKAADDYNALEDKIALAIPAGNQPDITESYPDHVARYGKASLALNNFISHPTLGYDQEEIDDFLAGLWAEGSSYDGEGSIMSMPFTKSSEALFYNETYFKEHGYELPERGFWTWDEIFEIAEDIKEREPESFPFGYDSSDNLFITGSEQWGAPYTGFSEKTGRGEVQFDNDQSKVMMNYFKDKVDRKLMLTRDLNSGAHTSDIMKKGEGLYMFVGSTGGARYSVQGSEEAFAKGYRVAVAPVPVKDVTERHQIQQGPNLSLFNSGDEQRMIAAWLFTKFMSQPEKTAEFALQSGYAPVRHSAYETETWQNYVADVQEDPANTAEAVKKVIKDSIEMFRDNDDVFFTSAVFNLSSKTRTEVGMLLNKIFAYNEYKTQAELDAYIKSEYRKSYNFLMS